MCDPSVVNATAEAILPSSASRPSRSRCSWSPHAVATWLSISLRRWLRCNGAWPERLPARMTCDPAMVGATARATACLPRAPVRWSSSPVACWICVLWGAARHDGGCHPTSPTAGQTEQGTPTRMHTHSLPAHHCAPAHRDPAYDGCCLVSLAGWLNGIVQSQSQWVWVTPLSAPIFYVWLPIPTPLV